jgi:2-polyprenyl-3-methyl-5-hydroxy-6-metoxy-1,4-benzoquinol methylase
MNKTYNFDPAPYSTHMLLVQEIPVESRVLEVGTASGYIGDFLIKQKKCEVWGVEPVKDLYEDALHFSYKKLWNCTVEEFVSEFSEAELFDVILLGDVLEHIDYPEKVLRALKKYLKPNGFFVISMPNIAHYSIRFNLFFGKWEMSDSGILDRTHLRFYTIESAKKMIESAGLRVEQIRPSAGGMERFGINKLLGVGQKLLFFWPTLFAYQFIYIVKNN